jgi:dCMP deaminase
MNQEKWDDRFLRLARFVSAWSKDPSTQVGAVIAKGNHIISMGYNGFPSALPDTPELYENREEKYGKIIHAERNAYLFARGDVTGSTLYTYPLPPCNECSLMYIQAGVARVVVPVVDIPLHWQENMKLAKTNLSLAGIEIKEIEVACGTFARFSADNE